MKKIILTMAIALTGLTVSAQEGFYVSLVGGPTYTAGEKAFTNLPGSSSGSFGEGTQGQIRVGYFFNDRFGVDLGVGYLHGCEQEMYKANGIEIMGRARAFGAALTGVANISKHVYVRAGVLTKLGGKTEVLGAVNSAIPTPAGMAPLSIEVERDNTGKFPIGFIGAFGVKHKIADNWSIFAEMDYQGISVDADRSKIANFSGTVGGQPIDKANLEGNIEGIIGNLSKLAQANPKDPRLAQLPTLYTLRNLIADEVVYVDNANPANYESESTQAPYSSFGFSFGLTYSF